jgi:serine/threonine-protein kinase
VEATADAAPALRKKSPVPLWAIAAALVLATVGGAILATRGATTEKVSTPDFGAGAAAKPAEPVRPAAVASPEPAPKPSVPVVSPTDLPLEKADEPPRAAPKGDREAAPPKPARPKTSGASSSCNPPYVIDAKGIKRLKPNCF